MFGDCFWRYVHWRGLKKFPAHWSERSHILSFICLVWINRWECIVDSFLVVSVKHFSSKSHVHDFPGAKWTLIRGPVQKYRVGFFWLYRFRRPFGAIWERVPILYPWANGYFLWFFEKIAKFMRDPKWSIIQDVYFFFMVAEFHEPIFPVTMINHESSFMGLGQWCSKIQIPRTFFDFTGNISSWISLFWSKATALPQI